MQAIMTTKTLRITFSLGVKAVSHPVFPTLYFKCPSDLHVFITNDLLGENSYK